MIVYLLQSDFYGAKYLWKRAPFSIKTESSEFTRVWEIGKSLIQNLIPNAYQIIKSNQWSENISMLINRLYVYIQNLSVTLIKGAYKTITVSEMMMLLDMDLAQCKEGIYIYKFVSFSFFV